MGTSVSLVLLLLAAIAQRPAPVVPAMDLDTGSETHTAISGYVGNDFERRAIDLGWAGITEIAWQENIDRPCWLEATGKDPEDASDTTYASTQACANPAGTSQRRVFFEGNPRYFVRGISVCTNGNANHRMKGIKVVAARLPADGDEVIETTVTDKATHINCADWHATVYCPDGQVANGVDIEVEDFAFVGLGLRCASRE